jgi:hypothetical protein
MMQNELDPEKTHSEKEKEAIQENLFPSAFRIFFSIVVEECRGFLLCFLKLK